jgi:DMSO/TMAO reductase YedYZ molybdopterin-dependent catalytic subunit
MPLNAFSAAVLQTGGFAVMESILPMLSIHRHCWAWAMKDGDLSVGFGGRLRLRVPHQLGYKSVKFVNRLMLTDSVKGFVSALDLKSPNYGYALYAGI